MAKKPSQWKQKIRKPLILFLKGSFFLGALTFVSWMGGIKNPINLPAHVVHHWHDWQNHLGLFQELDVEFRRTALENSRLRQNLEELQFSCAERLGHDQTEALATKAKRETGSSLGRSLASLHYEMPKHLLPNQLQALGIQYYKKNEFDKAAVILTKLSEYADEPTFKQGEHTLLAGMAWYHLENHEFADLYFRRTLEAPDSDERWKARAGVMRAVLAHQKKDKAAVDAALKVVLGRFPETEEARWITSTQ